VRSDLDSKALTVQQFQYYHSEAMIKARTTAWDYLTGEYIKETPRRPLSYWYEDRGDKENARYGAITQVVHYWHLMGVLHQQGFIVSDLARSLLRQHYVEWESALVPLLKASQNDNLDAQNLVKMMSWIKVPDPLTRGTNQRHGRAPARS
jgi:hypothetical protein